MSDLYQEPERDHFKNESPIRAFTTWSVEGMYAIGKGFRPSLQHLVPYLNAMETKEGWRLVQILEAATGSPSFVFRKEEPVMHYYRYDDLPRRENGPTLDQKWDQAWNRLDAGDKRYGPTVTYAMEYFTRDEDGNVSMNRTTWDDVPDWVQEALPNFGIEPPYIRNKAGFEEAGAKMDAMRARAESDFSDDVDPSSREVTSERKIGKSPAHAMPYGDDPINPKHYAGRECADIGERLSANGYQILKYCWRLGKKDDPYQELGKALWYAESESELLRVLARARGWRSTRPNLTGIKDSVGFLEDRITDQPQFTQNIARMLWTGYGQRELRAIIEAIDEHRFHLDCGRGLAI